MAVSDRTVTLKEDVHSVLLNCKSKCPWLFAKGVNQEALAAMAELVARGLAPAIEGRYVPRNYARKRIDRQQRDAAIWAAFTGSNYLELMHRFRVSRRLIYAILARKRKEQRRA